MTQTPSGMPELPCKHLFAGCAAGCRAWHWMTALPGSPFAAQPKPLCWRPSGTVCSKTSAITAWVVPLPLSKVHCRGQACPSLGPVLRAARCSMRPLIVTALLAGILAAAVKYYNPASNLCIVRCSRDEYRQVRSLDRPCHNGCTPKRGFCCSCISHEASCWRSKFLCLNGN